MIINSASCLFLNAVDHVIKALRAPHLENASAHSIKMATIYDVIYFPRVLRQYTVSP